MLKRNGLYVALDGGEGGGKTTIVRRMGPELEARGVPHSLVREPGGTPLGDALRAVLLDPQFTGEIDALEELFLMSTQRSALMRKIVRPALERGEIVVTDRIASSTYVYQLVARGRLDLAPVLEWINERVVTWPDMLFIFDIDPEIGIVRAKKRGELNRLDAESLDFHTRVRQGFLDFAEISPCPVRIIDASRSEEEVWAEIWGIVSNLIEVP